MDPYLLDRCSCDPRQHRRSASRLQAQETAVHWRPGVVGVAPTKSDLVSCSPLPESEKLAMSGETGWCQISEVHPFIQVIFPFLDVRGSRQSKLPILLELPYPLS